jgi:S-DNA-T family DNA segregation ATPase FtsK/SpoIIIE
MFVEAMCYSLMREHTPQEVNIYIMDFGAETLAAFSEAPHVGDVILSFETEKVGNLFKLLIGKLDTRKKILSQFGGSMAQYNMQADRPEPSLVVVINNYAAFTELFEEKSGEISYLTREGTKYGIYFVLACTGVNNVKFSLLQNFRRLYCLQLNNADDYSTAVGKTEGMLPGKAKGRGMFRQDKDSLLEFQTARVTAEDPPYGFIREFARKLSAQHSGAGAVSVPVLPEKVTEQFLAPRARRGDLGRVPIGVEKATLEIAYYSFSSSVVSLVLSMEQEWQAFADALGALVAARCGVKTIVLAPAGKTLVRSSSGSLQVFNDTGSCVGAVSDIFGVVLSRNNEYKDRLADGGALPQFEPLFVVIQSMSLLKTMLERYKPAKEAGEAGKGAGEAEGAGAAGKGAGEAEGATVARKGAGEAEGAESAENGSKEAEKATEAAEKATEAAEKAAEDDTPLNRLQLAMAKCDRAYNVHFVVAESLGSLTPLTVENWYKAHINGNSGIWVGSGIGSQYRLTVNKKPQDYSAELDSGFGFAVSGAAATLVKLLQ